MSSSGGAVFPVCQSLGSERPRIRLPVTFARQQLPQLASLQHMQACSIPCQLVLLPPGQRDLKAAASKLSLPEGLSVCRYDSGHRHEYHSHGLITSHTQCKLICEEKWFLVGLAMDKGVLQLLCSERLPADPKEEQQQDQQQHKRSRRESFHSDDSTADVSIQDAHHEHDTLMPQRKQHRPQSHLHHAALIAVQEPSVIRPHRPKLDQQDSLGPAALPPAGSNRAGLPPAASGAQQQGFAFGLKKKVTWADHEVEAPGQHSSLPAREADQGTRGGDVPQAAAAGAPHALLWQDLLLLQQLQQLSSLPAHELQELQQELTALEGAWHKRSGSGSCGAWSGRAGSCTGRCSRSADHILNQPAQHYKERALLMKRYGIRSGAAGQYELQPQHVQAVLEATMQPSPDQGAPGQLQQQHGEPCVKHAEAPAPVGPTGSDSSAHTCNSH